MGLSPKPKSPQAWCDRNEHAKQILAPHLGGLCEAATQQDIELLWSRACSAVSDVLQSIALNTADSNSRGQIPTFELVNTDCAPKKALLRSRRIAKCTSLLREIRKKVSFPETFSIPVRYQQFQSTVQNFTTVANLVGFTADLLSFDSPQSVEQIMADFGKLVRHQDSTKSNKSLKKWRDKLKISSYADRKAVHRWLRGGSATAPKFMKHQGFLTAKISTMLQTVSNRMKEIYSTHQDSDPDQMLHEFLNKYGEVIIPMKTNCELPVLSAVDFFFCVKASHQRKLEVWICGNTKNWNNFPQVVGLLFALWPCLLRQRVLGQRSYDAFP